MVVLDVLSSIAAMPVWALVGGLLFMVVAARVYNHLFYNGVYVKPYSLITLLPRALWMRLNIDDLIVQLVEENEARTVAVRIPSQPLLMITVDPANLEHVLKIQFENYVKGSYFFDRMQDVLGTGIFAVDGELWHSQRKMTSTLFYGRNFETNMTDVFQKHGKELVHLLDESLGRTIDIQDIFHRFTLDSIGDIAFGHTIGALTNERVAFATAWDRTNEQIFLRFFFPFFRMLKFLPAGRRVVKDIPFIKQFAAELVQKRRASVKAGENLEQADLLSLMLQRRDDNGNEFTDKFLVDMVLNIILAGRDTTAQSLTWTVMLLGQHPEVLRKLVAEIDEFVGDDVPTFQVVQNMHYLYAVISESLRLYPSVPRDAKVAIKQDTLPDGTVVPAGAAVVYAPYAMGRNKLLWGEDAYEFHPERFLKEEEGQLKRVKVSLFKFSAFQAGPRTCLGQNMAYLEESIALCMLLQKFTFELAPNQEYRIRMNLTCPMRDGLMVNMKPRADKKFNV